MNLGASLPVAFSDPCSNRLGPQSTDPLCFEAGPHSVCTELQVRQLPQTSEPETQITIPALPLLPLVQPL